MSIISRLLTSAAAGATKAPVFTYVASSLSTTPNTTSKTFSGFNIGTPSANRYVVVAVNLYANQNSTSLTGVTVGGQSTTICVTVVSGRSIAAICITDAPVTSGTTADIVITTSNNMFEVGCATYTAENIASTTPTDTGSSINSTGTFNASILADGAVIASAGNRGFNGFAGYPITFTNITTNFSIDGYASGIGYRAAGASFVSLTDTSKSFSFNQGGDAYQPVAVYASFR